MVTLVWGMMITGTGLVMGCKEEHTTFTILTGYVFRDPASIITTQVKQSMSIKLKPILE